MGIENDTHICFVANEKHDSFTGRALVGYGVRRRYLVSFKTVTVIDLPLR